MTGRHRLSREKAVALVRKVHKTGKTRQGRQRKICPVVGCETISSRMGDHLRRAHNLTEVERARLILDAPVSAVVQVDPLTPMRRVVPCPSCSTDVGTNGSSPVAAGPSASVPPRPADQSIVPDAVYSKVGKTFHLIVKRFGVWLESDAGGGRTEEMAHHMVGQIQSFFIRFGGDAVGLINEANINTFVRELSAKMKLSTVAFYVRSLSKFVEYLNSRCLVSDDRYRKLKLLCGNVALSMKRKARQQRIRR